VDSLSVSTASCADEYDDRMTTRAICVVQAVPHLSGVSAALRRPPVPRPGLDSNRPGRRLLDEREMEMIELGGAPP